ncbi:MAG: hypothetical protein WCS21_07805 [Lachnospiraceae bacterium]
MKAIVEYANGEIGEHHYSVCGIMTAEGLIENIKQDRAYSNAVKVWISPNDSECIDIETAIPDLHRDNIGEPFEASI